MAKQPGHYTNGGTRKYQANGRVEWARTFAAAAQGGREGEGIRAALAYSVAHEAQFLAWAAKTAGKAPKPARAPKAAGKAARAPKAAGKAARAPKAAGKAARAAGKAPKPARPAKPPRKAPEQVELPAVA